MAVAEIRETKVQNIFFTTVHVGCRKTKQWLNGRAAGTIHTGVLTPMEGKHVGNGGEEHNSKQAPWILYFN